MRTLAFMGAADADTSRPLESVPAAPVPERQAALRRDLAGFRGTGYDRGRNILWQIAWQFISGLIVVRWWCPTRARATILRGFGAQIGANVVIRQRVRIHWPWKLSVGDNSWIGDSAWILNLEPVTIGSDVCISQEVLLCTGSHDRRSPTFEFDNGPIVIGDGAWIAARATVLRGSTIGHDSVIGACALAHGVVAPGTVVQAPKPDTRGLPAER